MLHVSTDGPARPPYVNVAFQQEEIRRRRGASGGCWAALSRMHTSSFYFPLFSEACMFLHANSILYICFCSKLYAETRFSNLQNIGSFLPIH